MTDIRVAIVDDHPIVCEGLFQVVSGFGGFSVTGMGHTAADAIDLARRTAPDILILDLGIPGSGVAAIREITRIQPGTRILILTISEHPQDVQDALRQGASGYVLKGISGDELCRVLIGLFNGLGHITPHLGARIIASISQPPALEIDAGTIALSKREVEIYTLIRRGFCNKEIGRFLSLSEKTVKHYLGNIFRKLNVRNRTELALHSYTAAVQHATESGGPKLPGVFNLDPPLVVRTHPI